MRLEKKLDEELARRKGMTKRTLLSTAWLLVSGVIAYFVITYAFAEGLITTNQVYEALSLPRSVPDWTIKGLFIVITVIFMQMFLFVGYAFGSPEGRRKTGAASLHTYHPDDKDTGY